MEIPVDINALVDMIEKNCKEREEKIEKMCRDMKVLETYRMCGLYTMKYLQKIIEGLKHPTGGFRDLQIDRRKELEGFLSIIQKDQSIWNA